MNKKDIIIFLNKCEKAQIKLPDDLIFLVDDEEILGEYRDPLIPINILNITIKIMGILRFTAIRDMIIGKNKI